MEKKKTGIKWTLVIVILSCAVILSGAFIQIFGNKNEVKVAVLETEIKNMKEEFRLMREDIKEIKRTLQDLYKYVRENGN